VFIGSTMVSMSDCKYCCHLFSPSTNSNTKALLELLSILKDQLRPYSNGLIVFFISKIKVQNV